MKYFRIIAVFVVFCLVAIQFFRPERNNAYNPSAVAIAKVVTVPADVAMILKTACYDCHSNYTKYPWYANIQPIAWVLANHIKDGKSELNFSEFGSYSARRQKSKLSAVADAIKDKTMPLTSYTLIHNEARLSKKQKELVISWVDKTLTGY
ncbi:MAG: heme-binding domain-containing protein [Pedobacter sp.]|nr:heme-binding domain-containing protein [Pedobacter sp.]